MSQLGMRLIQISFKRLPDEHADMMIRAGRYFLQSQGRRPVLPYLAGALLFGALSGVGLEAYRQYVLAPFFGIANLPEFGIIVFEMLPVAFAIAAGAFVQHRLAVRARRKNLIRNLDKEVMIDIDVHEYGMEIARDGQVLTYEWTAFRKVEMAKGFLVFQQDDAIFSIPARAFKDKNAYLTQSHEIIGLWKEARKAALDEAAAAKMADALDLEAEKEQTAPTLKSPGSNPASRSKRS